MIGDIDVKIYVDMLFAINFSMDLISLYITASIMRKKVFKKRMLASAIIGGVYGVLSVIWNLSAVFSAILSVFVSLLMCFVSYYEKNIKRLTGIYVVYWGISACLGGFMSVLYSFLNKLLSEYIKNYSYTQVYTGARFFVILAISIIASMLFGRFFSTEKEIRSASIDVIINEKSFSVNALCDSGNLLTEPLSGKGVVLVSLETALGAEIESVPDIYKRYIPYTSVGAEGIIKGVLPKSIKINGEEKNAIIASVSKKSFAGYEACVPKSLV